MIESDCRSAYTGGPQLVSHKKSPSSDWLKMPAINFRNHIISESSLIFSVRKFIEKLPYFSENAKIRMLVVMFTLILVTTFLYLEIIQENYKIHTFIVVHFSSIFFLYTPAPQYYG